jgi:hypothetical protein
MDVTLALWVACTTWAAPSNAVETEVIRISYAATQDCPTRLQFVSEIRARTKHVRVSASESVRHFDIAVQSVDGGYSGMLRIMDAGQVPAVRKIEGETCQSVAVALAIAAALAVDPQADTTPEAAALDAPPPATKDPGEPADKKKGKKPAKTQPAPASPAPVILPAPARAATEPGRVFSVGVAMVATWGPAPEVLLAPAPFAALEFAATGPWQIALRLQPMLAQTGTIGPQFEAATFRLMALRVEGCPLVLDIRGLLSVRPCLAVDAGAVRAEGKNIARPRSETRAWASAGARGRLVWMLGKHVFLDAAAGAQFAATRDEYVFRNPRNRLYQPAVLSPTAEFSLGGRFF